MIPRYDAEVHYADRNLGVVLDLVAAHTPEREEELRRVMALPLQRWGTAEDIGAAVVYLAAPASSWITGQVLYVTGGA